MSTATVTIDVDMREAQRLLATAPLRLQAALMGGMNDATDLLLQRMRTYPPKSTGKVQFVSEKQRRFFFWALSEGIITVPYRRTRNLANSWSRTVAAMPGGVVGDVGSNSGHAPYNRRVQDRTVQARIHRGNWPTVQDVTERSTGEVNAFFAARIRVALGR